MTNPLGEPSGRRLGTMKVARPRLPSGRALGPGQHDEDVGVHVGAEVLVAEEDPLVAVLDGPGGVGTDVAAALALGQEHPALPGRLGVEAVSLASSSSRTPAGA